MISLALDASGVIQYKHTADGNTPVFGFTLAPNGDFLANVNGAPQSFTGARGLNISDAGPGSGWGQSRITGSLTGPLSVAFPVTAAIGDQVICGINFAPGAGPGGSYSFSASVGSNSQCQFAPGAVDAGGPMSCDMTGNGTGSRLAYHQVSGAVNGDQSVTLTDNGSNVLAVTMFASGSGNGKLRVTSTATDFEMISVYDTGLASQDDVVAAPGGKINGWCNLPVTAA